GEGGLARATRSHQCNHFTGARIKIDVAQDQVGIAILFHIGKTDILEANAVVEWPQFYCTRPLLHVVLRIHELEYLRRSDQGLLEIIVELRKLPNRVIQLKDGDDES